MLIKVCGFHLMFKGDELIKLDPEKDLSVPLNPEEIDGPAIECCPACFPMAVNMVHKLRLAAGLDDTGMGGYLRHAEELLTLAADQEDGLEDDEDEDDEDGLEDEEEEDEEEEDEEDEEEEDEEEPLPPTLDHEGVRRDLAKVRGVSSPASSALTSADLTDYGKKVVRDWGVDKGIQNKKGMLKDSTVYAYARENGTTDSHIFLKK